MGRTGTFIALDILAGMSSSGGLELADPAAIVMRLRSCRFKMVQNAGQVNNRGFEMEREQSSKQKNLTESSHIHTWGTTFHFFLSTCLHHNSTSPGQLPPHQSDPLASSCQHETWES